METSRDQPVVIQVVRDAAEWDALRDEWETLYESSPYSSTPLDFTWLRGWWRVYGAAYGAGLRIVTIRRGSRLIGAAPLYIRNGMKGSLGARHLQFISTGEAEDEETCPDYMNILCLRGEEATCAHSVWSEVGRMDWDHLEFLDLPEDSPLLESPALPRNARVVSRGSCPVAELTGGFEAYLARLSPNSRQQARRLLREGEKVGARLEVIQDERATEAFHDLIKLHQQRWTLDGKLGVFAARRFVEFHRNLIGEWLPAGRAVLTRLSLAGNPIAVLYGFVTAQKFDFYQSGVSKEDAGLLRSPGNLAHLLSMRTFAERGVTEYDFLRGSSSYKQRLTTCENRLVGIRLWRPTVGTVIDRGARLAASIDAKRRRLMDKLNQ